MQNIMNLENPIFGIVFDLSLNHYSGNRIIDLVKNQIIDFATCFGLDCKIYVSHPKNKVIPKTQGESVKLIGEHPYNDLYGWALLMNCLDVLKEEKAKIIFISDRYDGTKTNQYNKVLKLNKTKSYECEFHFILLGKEEIKLNCEKIDYLNDPNQIRELIRLNYGC